MSPGLSGPKTILELEFIPIEESPLFKESTTWFNRYQDMLRTL